MSDSFPVESFKDAAPHLRRPFTENAVRFKNQAGAQGGALVVSYIDARLAIERLNHVIPHLWSDEYEALAGGSGLLCHLTVDGITRLDVGSGYRGKGLYSDAFKRAAVKFGVGVSLYAIPRIILKTKAGHLDQKGNITPDGQTRCRDLYAGWLKETGERAFGEPLDHGDAPDATGDADAELEAASSHGPAEEEPAAERLTDAKGTALIGGAEELYKTLPKEAVKDLPPAAFRRALVGAWSSHEALDKLIADLEKRK